MTVGQLIARLKLFPEHSRLFVTSDGHMDISQIDYYSDKNETVIRANHEDEAEADAS